MRVAVAIITDANQNILITRRSLHASHGGMWEFPGGKLENEELATAALIREIKEEVGIDVRSYSYLGEVHHTYDQKAVSLLIYHVYDYQGEAVCREAQMDLRWVDIKNLNDFQFPAANLEIIELIRQKICSAELG
jgi:8-oxo-dGTP diphosphatase